MPYKDKNKNREYQREWYYKFHEARLIANRAKKQRYIREGRCRDCGVKLIEGENRKCQNCSSDVFRREIKYAKDSMRLAKII
jgi:predicted Zn-ribbon and HTH transcriptional regulator